LIDTSTNGSFVTLDDKPEMLLHMEELLLSGKGRINFGHSYNGTDLSCALNFEIA
jgi:predicted flavoprotein YhiN